MSSLKRKPGRPKAQKKHRRPRRVVVLLTEAEFDSFVNLRDGIWPSDSALGRAMFKFAAASADFTRLPEETK